MAFTSRFGGLLGALFVCCATFCAGSSAADPELTRLAYNNPGLIVDLGVGLWGNPIPCDRNNDNLSDLILVSEGGPKGSPSPGVFYFENTGTKEPSSGNEIFKPAVRLSDSVNDLKASYTREGIRVLSPGYEYPDFIQNGARTNIPLSVKPTDVHQCVASEKIRVRNYGIRGLRGYHWGYADYNGDSALDLFVGAGDWSDYGWDNAYDQNGRWVNGPLHGYVYVLLNTGTTDQPRYGKPQRVKAGGEQVDVYGTPSPNFADLDLDGDLDLICGEFVDGLTYFENIGSRTHPRYAHGQRLRYPDGGVINVPLCMLVVAAYDWDRDGHIDLVLSQEDGRAGWLRNQGTVANGLPQFERLRFFQQQAQHIKFGVLSSPAAVDWNGDQRQDLLVGNAAGEVAFIENLGGNPPRWAAPRLLESAGKPIRIAAGYNGSIQGPAESKWGYANISAGDWDGDGLPDLMLSSIFGRVVLYKNIGTRTEARLAAGQPLKVAWESPVPKPAWTWWDPAPGELVTQWRSTPAMIDLDGDKLTDLVTLDQEGYLALFRQVQRDGKRIVLPGERVFRLQGKSVFDSRHEAIAQGNGLLRMNGNTAGASGRRTFCFADWDRDGKLDLLVNSVNINFLKNVSTQPGEWIFKDEGPVDTLKLAGHSTSPTFVDWDGNGTPDLVTGAEDGFLYYLRNPGKP